MANVTSQHILSTAANLLGFCLFVITSMHVFDRSATSIVDELTSTIALSLILSCLLSFFSIRSSNATREKRLETVAECFFALALLGILIIVVFIALHIIN